MKQPTSLRLVTGWSKIETLQPNAKPLDFLNGKKCGRRSTFFPFYFLCNLPIDKQDISWYNWAGRPRLMRPEIPLYHSPANLSSILCSAFSTIFYPEICAIWLLTPANRYGILIPSNEGGHSHGYYRNPCNPRPRWLRWRSVCRRVYGLSSDARLALPRWLYPIWRCLYRSGALRVQYGVVIWKTTLCRTIWQRSGLTGSPSYRNISDIPTA